MTDVTTLLREADPLRDGRSGDADLSPEHARALRRAMLAAIPERMAVFPAWRRPAALAAVAAMMLVVSGIAGHRISSERLDRRAAPSAGPAGSGPVADVDCRQLQFATPGGTRIIWIFDENLRLQESMP
jgi:hypothetical protein